MIVCIYVGYQYDYKRVLTAYNLAKEYLAKNYTVFWYGNFMPNNIKVKPYDSSLVNLVIKLNPMGPFNIAFENLVAIKFNKTDKCSKSNYVYDPTIEGLFGKEDFKKPDKKDNLVGIQCSRNISEIQNLVFMNLQNLKQVKILEKRKDSQYCNRPNAIQLCVPFKFPSNLNVFITTNTNDISLLSSIQAIISGVPTFSFKEFRNFRFNPFAHSFDFTQYLKKQKDFINNKVITWKELSEKLENKIQS